MIRHHPDSPPVADSPQAHGSIARTPGSRSFWSRSFESSLAEGSFPPLRPTRGKALAAYRRIREFSSVISGFLEPEDCVVQTMPDVSPTRWHLAHTTWFFEAFVLCQLQADYRSPNEQFHYLFNSYYNSLGEPFLRNCRGLLSRPTMAEVWQYRRQVDRSIESLLQGERGPTGAADPEWERISPVFQTGLQHEQQHQELMLTDIKHVFSCNPLYPAFDPDSAAVHGSTAAIPRPSVGEWVGDPGGIVAIGHRGDHFAYDNEQPRHEILLQPFKIGRTVVTNGQFLEFIDDGGYQNPGHWLDAGWKMVQQQHLAGPLYWLRREAEWWEFTLGGLRPLRAEEPVCHVSFFEADAYARWRGCRLPSEGEWERVASQWVDDPASYGAFADDRVWHPQPPQAETPQADNLPVERPHDAAASRGTSRSGGPRQLFGDVWEWTASPYLGYPGYRPPSGAIGEYNGKFMCNQFVLRGGSVATSRDHLRVTYRNFFPPEARWQFSGIRLAIDS